MPFIDQVLDSLAVKQYFSFLGGFSGYNQIQIALEDQDKTTFTYPWGDFSYRLFPFVLCNAPTTSVHDMYDVFRPFIANLVIVYLEDILIFNKT